MAKMNEGLHYYYLPHTIQGYREEDMFHICRRDAPHPNLTVIASYLDQDNASLIVDALNYFHTTYHDMPGTFDQHFGRTHGAP